MCGACCSGSEGYVLFTDDDARAIAARLGITVEEFLGRYTHDMGVEIAGRRRSINEVPTDHGLDCVFLDRTTMPGKALCSIHRVAAARARLRGGRPGDLHPDRTGAGANRAAQGRSQGARGPER
jgi:hypothetical protein